jgi:RNA polymerase sigma-70 factor (ECF subfamily)
MLDREGKGATGLVAAPGEEALERCRRGEDGPDHAAFRTLYESERPEVERFLERLLGDPQAVEDAVQDTFVRLHRSLASFEAGRPLRPYVLAIARNVAMDSLRTRQKSKKIEDLDAEPRAHAVDPVEQREHAANVEAALAALEGQHRSIILMRYSHELKQEEIADALACTVRTVRNRLRAASALFERELVRRGVLARPDEGRKEVSS